MKEDDRATDLSTSIFADEWHKHFSDLNQIKHYFLDKEKQFQSYLNKILNIKTFFWNRMLELLIRNFFQQFEI